ncbi:MAG: DNA repair protein RecN [Bacteroidetes bacterium]|nr:MAG: DNA repair protein RecN [Bacteroidota bacterium]
MIRSLYIRNYLLIESLELEFTDGFSTITGETGAGKSILMGALSLILGQRVDNSVLKLKDAKCIVEGCFSPNEVVDGLCDEHGLDRDEELTIRREVAPSGKSRAFVNDTPVTLPLLREIGLQLVDIHSQHQSLRLGDRQYQLEVLDYLAGHEDVLSAYTGLYIEYTERLASLLNLKQEAARAKEDLDYMQFQFDELCAASLKEGEMEELEADLQRASHAEEIRSGFFESANALGAEQTGILEQLKRVVDTFDRLARFYSPAEVLKQRFESVYIELKDLDAELLQHTEKSELEPGSLEQLQARIDELYSLMQKHRVQDADELIGLREELGKKIESVALSDERIHVQEEKLAACREALNKLAERLHMGRQKAGKGMESSIVSQLVELGIPHARFSVEVERRREFGPSGADDLRFLFSANKQLPQEEVSRVASGGEISRLMLCIKALVSDRQGLPTLIFDEIDTGVSGEIADRMGGIMARLAGSHQVIAITHLPQVASRGREHFMVYKEDRAEASYTRIRKLKKAERVEEIARMLSGTEVSDEALSNARVLLGL